MTFLAEHTDVEPHLRTEGERKELLPLLEALADRLFQTVPFIIGSLRDAGLTVVPLNNAAREIAPAEHAAESKAREEAMQAELTLATSTIRAMTEQARADADERDRLKGELAEARRLIATARNHLSSAADIIMEDGGDEDDDRDEREFIQVLDLFLGATKAHAFVAPARGGQGCIAVVDEKTGKTCGEWSEHPIHATPSPAESTGAQKESNESVLLKALEAASMAPCMREDCAVRAAGADPNYPCAPAAPQEQAGHAFAPKTGAPTLCHLCWDAGKGAIRAEHPIHTGAKP